MTFHNSHISMLESSVSKLNRAVYDPYLKLKSIKPSNGIGSIHFRTLFSEYYAKGKPQLKDSFFQTGLNSVYQNHTFQEALSLIFVKTRRVEAVYTSKLLNLFNEEHPILDSKVYSFFNLSSPREGYTQQDKILIAEERIEGLRGLYSAWSSDAKISGMLKNVKLTHPDLSSVHSNRIYDFLIWLC
jgi:hypothetical protein